MGNKHKSGEAVYQKIAYDMAEKIALGKYTEGEVISGRSSLAAQYSVSPETIRRAAALLQEWGIVSSSAGAGIKILSKQKAVLINEKLHNFNEIMQIKQQINTLMEQQKQYQQLLEKQIEVLLDYIEKKSLASPIKPYEIQITSQCRFIGKKVSEVAFWQQTGVTVVGISRSSSLSVSPGPDAVFAEGDVFIFVGPEGSWELVYKYLYN